MKKTLFAIVAAAVVCGCSGSNDGKYTIKGRFMDCRSDSVWLFDAENGGVLASAPCSDGSFELSGKIDVPVMGKISSSQFGIGQACEVVVEPGELVMTTIADSLYVIKGSKANDNICQLKESMFELTEKLKETDGRVTEEIMPMIEAYEESFKTGLKDNLDNYFGIICLQSLDRPDDPESTKIFLDRFSDKMKKTSAWKNLNESVENRMKLGVGKPYLDFTQNDADGNPVKASAVMVQSKNRYVLIDFWASWCGPCMGEVSYLRDAYNRYSSRGFEIIGVSLDQDRDSWLDAVRDEKMNWIHVSDLKYWNNEVAELYNIHSIPSNFLIDCRTGLIVDKNLRGNALIRKLAELFR